MHMKVCEDRVCQHTLNTIYEQEAASEPLGSLATGGWYSSNFKTGGWLSSSFWTLGFFPRLDVLSLGTGDTAIGIPLGRIGFFVGSQPCGTNDG